MPSMIRVATIRPNQSTVVMENGHIDVQHGIEWGQAPERRNRTASVSMVNLDDGIVSFVTLPNGDLSVTLGSVPGDRS